MSFCFFFKKIAYSDFSYCFLHIRLDIFNYSLDHYTFDNVLWNLFMRSLSSLFLVVEILLSYFKLYTLVCVVIKLVSNTSFIPSFFISISVKADQLSISWLSMGMSWWRFGCVQSTYQCWRLCPILLWKSNSICIWHKQPIS